MLWRNLPLLTGLVFLLSSAWPEFTAPPRARSVEIARVYLTPQPSPLYKVGAATRLAGAPDYGRRVTVETLAHLGRPSARPVITSTGLWLLVMAGALVGAGVCWICFHRLSKSWAARKLEGLEAAHRSELLDLEQKLSCANADAERWRSELTAVQQQLDLEKAACTVLRDANARLQRRIDATTAKREAFKAKKEEEAKRQADYASGQLEVIQDGQLRQKLLLNAKEDPVFRECVRLFGAQKLRICPQASMGEFIRSDRANDGQEKLWLAYNSKRVDILICTPDWRPLIVVEHHGGGHGQGNAKARDAVKEAALAKIGLEMVVTYDHDRPQDRRARLQGAVDRALTARASPSRRAG